MRSKTLWWPFLMGNKLRVVVILLLGLAVSYFTLLLPLSIGKYFEINFGEGGNKTMALQLLGVSLPEGIFNFFNFFLLITILKFMGSWGYIYYSSLLGESFVAKLRHSFLRYHLEQDSGETAGRKASILLPFSNDVKTMQQLLVKGVLGLTKDLIFLAMSLYVLFSLQPLLTSAVVILTGLFYCLHRWFNQVHKPLFARKRKKQAGLLNHVSEMLSSKWKPMEADLIELDKRTIQLRRTLARYHARKSLLTATTPFMLYLMLAVIMIIITLGYGYRQLTPGEVVVYILLLMTLFPTIRNIIRIEHTWVQGSLAAEKFIRAKGADKSEISEEKSKKETNNSFSLLQPDNKGN